MPAERTLIIKADDYGYSDRFDEGILEAARAGAIDAVGVMVLRDARPEALLAAGIEVGLHLELEPGEGRAGPGERERAAAAIRDQLDRFEASFGRPPAFLDGHRHCHARDGLGVVVADAASERRLAVRAVDMRHRRLMRCRGVATPDALIGRVAEGEPALPPQLEDPALLPARARIVEWMVHPGRRDPDHPSRYNRGREEDLELLLDLELTAGWRRSTHREALFGG